MSRSGLEVVYRLCRGGIEVVLMWPTGCQEVVPRCSRSVLEVVYSRNIVVCKSDDQEILVFSILGN